MCSDVLVHKLVRVAFVSILLTSQAFACGGGSGQKLAAARNAIRSTLSHADEVTRSTGKVDESLLQRLEHESEYLRGFGDDLTEADRRLIDQADRAEMAVRARTRAEEAANVAAERLSADAASVAQSAAPTANQRFQNDLDTVTEDIVTDLACDFIADALSPSERVEAGTPLVWWPSEPSTGRLVEEAVKSLVNRGWSSSSMNAIVDWSFWGQGVLESAQNISGLTPPGTMNIAGTAHSRAFYYYVKLCHGPPSGSSP